MQDGTWSRGDVASHRKMELPKVSLSRIALVIAVVSCHLGPVSGAVAQRTKAIVGEPFGVAHVSLPLPADPGSTFLQSNGLEIADPTGRVHYPAISTGRLGELAEKFLGTDELPLPGRLEISFLFTGTEPFEITILTPEPQQVLVSPKQRRGRAYRASLAAWWRAYHAQLRAQQARGDYPPLVETYLTEMLGARLRLQPPLLSRVQEDTKSELQQTVDLLLGSEDLRLATIRDMMRGGGDKTEPADIPVPEPINWQPHEFPGERPLSDIEPIALHVPAECFYVRFGSFENYIWMDHLKDDYGGRLGQMVTLRGHNAKLDEKVQDQLALKQSEMKELLGPQVISDVALIGRDLYLREGAALGMLFEAKGTAALKASFHQDRIAALAAEMESGATLETITVGGHEVSFLSTPDNRLRSFYAIDGDYHLVTTSRAIVERFFEAGAGNGALGTSAEFQHARQVMPLAREDTVFAYFSTAFFHSLLSPEYQIGLARRLRQAARTELVRLAGLAAAAEGKPHGTLQDLVEGRFLPNRILPFQEQPAAPFPRQADAGNGQDRLIGGPRFPSDHAKPPGTVAGKAGGFADPIPDAPLTALTRTEAADFQQAAAYFQSQWQQMDPLMVGIKRYALPGERMERVVIDGNISPLVEEKYGWLLSLVGPPTEVTIQSNPADVVTLQMSLQGGTRWPNIAAHHLFLGVQDTPVGGNLIPTGRLSLLRLLKTTPGFLGAWPQLGLLDLLPFAPPPDVAGFSPLPLGLWRWQGDGFSVLSFHHDVLADAAAHLQPVPTENRAQIRLRVSDLSHSQLAGWVTSMNYSRAYQTSLGNARLLHTLSQQLRVPREQALDLANSLLGTELVCTLGGSYALYEENDVTYWRSTAWPEGDRVPADYQAPLLGWFRGASIDFTKFDNELVLHAEIDMQRKERAPQLKLPTFNLFKRKAAE